MHQVSARLPHLAHCTPLQPSRPRPRAFLIACIRHSRGGPIDCPPSTSLRTQESVLFVVFRVDSLIPVAEVSASLIASHHLQSVRHAYVTRLGALHSIASATCACDRCRRDP